MLYTCADSENFSGRGGGGGTRGNFVRPCFREFYNVIITYLNSAHAILIQLI